jgi:hypothetical protein
MLFKCFLKVFSIFQRPAGAFGKQFELAKLNVSRSNNFLRATHGVALKKHFGSWQSQLPNNFSQLKRPF